MPKRPPYGTRSFVPFIDDLTPREAHRAEPGEGIFSGLLIAAGMVALLVAGWLARGMVA